ncbi:MAG: serine hydrolase [Pirellulaceae bacterium]|nr:serine hydrolase [Pirellulaceae bacterium]
MLKYASTALCGVIALWLTTTAVRGDLREILTPLAEAHRGQVAIAVKHLETGESFAYRAEIPMPTASLIKFAVMVETYRQAAEHDVDLNQLIVLREEDKVPGSGILSSHFSSGAQLHLRDAVRLMIVYSDNTATNLVLDQIGIRSTADQMSRMGFENTKLHAKVFRRDTSVFPERSRQFGLGSSTAAEMLSLFAPLHAGQLVSKDASEAMLDHLLHCDDRSKLVRDLPPGTRVAHKSGAVAKARCDAGIIYSPAGPIAVCVMTSENEDMSWQASNQASDLCARVGRLVYDHFNLGASPTVDETVLRIGATGRLVEQLQRTLNTVLDPTPALSVDGDFGPQTEAAVIRLQDAKKLDATGRVDEATWLALGPLVTSDKPVPAPAIVNAEELPLQPVDGLEGSPFVTCRAWAIANAQTGRMLWSHNSDQSLDIASTTKLMTALVILRLAEEDPDILAEEIVFSKRADQTHGSTSGLAEGERLTAGECLYGLLLPSGNDASVALAEHFGNRFSAGENVPGAERANADDKEGNAKDGPLARFVAEMNRTAESLAMSRTSYRNPHGLTAEGHVSTAADLTRLAYAAWQLPTLRKYVGTRQYGCTVAGPGGYRRNVVWRNTNQLLKTEGYYGLKTGTTTKAGACLVSTARRDDDQILVVVLGASSSDARYVDSRNLYRWAWQQLGHRPSQ